MQILKTPIPGLLEIEPRIFGDQRGYFFESYNQKAFAEAGIDVDFVQDNQSLSGKDVLRGLHFQAPPYEQGKLVRVIHGAVLDVVVDIRKGSPTYGQHHKVLLSAKNKKTFWIPPGFAHGFLTLEDETIFFYKCTGFYNKESEGSVRWNDPHLNIDWEVKLPQLSPKDEQAPLFKELKSPFSYA